MQYAGNVLVYSAISPCNGDWFGGINTKNADAFLDALADVEFGSSGGVSDDTLRQYWRGRMGLTKEEQLQVSEKRVVIPATAEHESPDLTRPTCFDICVTRAVPDRRPLKPNH